MTDDNHKLPSPPDMEGAALPPVDVSFEGLGLGEKTVTALEAMAYEGISLHIAARRLEMKPQNLTRAFNLPHVRRVYNQLVSAIRQNAAQEAYIRMVDLSQTSSSDHVRLEANKWIAGVGGIAALKRVEGRIHHTHAFGGFEFEEPETVDITPDDDGGDIKSPGLEGEE